MSTDLIWSFKLILKRTGFLLFCASLMTAKLVCMPAVAVGQDGEVTRLERFNRLSKALEDYQPTFLDRSERIEVFRDDTSGSAFTPQPEGASLLHVLNLFADRNEAFDLACVAVIRGPTGNKIEFYDVTEEGSDDASRVIVVAGDMVVVMFPREDED